MINLEELIRAEPHQLANLICYLSHDCERCPVYQKGEWDPSLAECKRQLYNWIMSEKDVEFWKYITDGG